MKRLLRQAALRLGLHVYTNASLPMGVDWLHDIRRAGVTRPAPVCLDVGANIGQTVTALLRDFPQACVHAFEPFHEPRTALIAATRADRRVTVVPLAMGAEEGSVLVQPNRVSVFNSLGTRPHDPGGLPAESIRVDTLDRYCAREDISHVDILKIDTEGHDLEVLRGASGLLAEQQVKFVLCEVSFLEGSRVHTLFTPVLQLMNGHGYRFLGVYETYPLHRFAEPMVFCNALFVSAQARSSALARFDPLAAAAAPRP